MSSCFIKIYLERRGCGVYENEMQIDFLKRSSYSDVCQELLATGSLNGGVNFQLERIISS